MFPYLRSDVTGNCLYSSASLVQVGNNSLMESLRVLTSIELFNNAEFYSQHPCFSAVVNEHAECFSKSINNLLPMSASEECSDTGCTKANLVRQEPFLIAMRRSGHHFFAYWVLLLF